MDKFWISIVFLVLLYIAKILVDYKRFYDDPDCFNLYEKLQDSKATYSIAIPLSYIYCLAGAYEECINNLFCTDFLNLLLICIGVLIPVVLISVQNKGNNGVANSFSDMSGAIFFISAVIKSSLYFWLYTIVFAIVLLFFIVKCEKKDNYVLYKLIAIGVDAVLIIPSIFCDKNVTCLFTMEFLDNMLYYSTLMFVSEIFIPPISNWITTLLFDRYKCSE